MAPELLHRLERGIGTRRGSGPWWLSAACTAVVLAVLAVFTSPDPLDHAMAEEHHAAAKRVEDAIPFTIGRWVGRDVPVPTSAVDLLKPNVLVSRRFENVETQETADLLIVQCFDSRDLAGHYPPVCYPAHGKTPGTTVALTWEIADFTIPSKRYTFTEEDTIAEQVIVVDNFMVLPTGKFGRDRADIDRVGKDRQLRLLGAAQVQFLTSGSMEDERRDEVFEEIVGSVVPLLRPFLAQEVASE